jgi:magnesium chelatase subunit D
MGTMPGDPRSGARLSPVATLRAAAPWQPLRRAERADSPAEGLIIQRDDFRVVRFRERSESTTVFVVDASGSAALNRLAEAKGAVELLLADCYIRRDQVALIAFRGDSAEVLLPPTRSLVRAKRNLAALPGGGGTPLASAIEAAAVLADSLRRRGGTPHVVFLTDGRGNIARDGGRGREAAREDLPAAAALFRECGARCMVIDTSPRPTDSAEELARQLHANYLPLPHADASQLRDAVRLASG